MYTTTRNYKTPLTNFTQITNTAESLQMTMNPYFMGRPSVTFTKPLMMFTGIP